MENVLVITFWSYKDALIQTYCLPYVKIISENITPQSSITLVTFEQPQYHMTEDEKINIENYLATFNIKLLPIKYHKIWGIKLLAFPFQMFYLWFLLFTKKISTIHCFCTPAGVIGYILAFLSSKRLIIDSFEPHAEPMVETKTWKKTGVPFKILFFLKKLMAKKANALILCVPSMKNYVKEKFNVSINDEFVKPACIDFTFFDWQINGENLRRKLKLNDKIVAVYAGNFGGLYLKRETIEIFKAAYDYWGENFSILLLSNHNDDELQQWYFEVGLPIHIIVKLFVNFSEMPRYLACANFAISPYNPIPSRRFGAPIKNAEYMAMGLPILITKNSSNDSETIQKNDIGAVIQELNYDSYLKSIKKIDQLLKSNDEKNLKAKIATLAKHTKSFEIAKNIYKELYTTN